MIEFMLLNGAENFIEYQKKNMHVIKTLKEYQYIDEIGHDQGANGTFCNFIILVRQMSKKVTGLLTDDAKLRELRAGRGRTRDRIGYEDVGRVERSPERGDDDDLKRAIEASKADMAQEEQRRLARKE